MTTSAGPGIVLKQETIGLGIMLELPLLILDIQRAGPSTGMPTKPEQADLLMVLFGRNSESPVPVLAASTPSQCFHAAIEAARIALKYRTPVYLLSRRLPRERLRAVADPDVADLPDISTEFVTESATASSCRTCATPRRSRGRGRFRGRPGSSTASAGSRRRT